MAHDSHSPTLLALNHPHAHSHSLSLPRPNAHSRSVSSTYSPSPPHYSSGSSNYSSHGYNYGYRASPLTRALSQSQSQAQSHALNPLQKQHQYQLVADARFSLDHSPLRQSQTATSFSASVASSTAPLTLSAQSRHLSQIDNPAFCTSPTASSFTGAPALHPSSAAARKYSHRSSYSMGAHSHSRSRDTSALFSHSFASMIEIEKSVVGKDGHHEHGHGCSHGHNHDHDHDHAHNHSEPDHKARSVSRSHEHSHSHSHSHDHKHSHSHSHSHDHKHDHDHDHDHAHDHGHTHFHAHDSSHSDADKSAFTKFLMRYTTNYPFLNAIMAEKDSRRILYYMLLNVSFMMVQAFYGYVTDSLGLLSDTVHMFFDCMALLVGLVASVLGKRPPSQRFPYGLGKIETLSGFTNGILLVLLSVEITFEAFERIWEGSETKRLGELLAVSVMGMLVNLVGMMAFGHHHHSHGGHSHSHSHDHDHDHDHGHSHGCGGHDNENMQGIYLHVLADTLGSASVVVSTILTYFTGHSFWDQLASVFISVLILASSKPLIFSAARRLLLGIPDSIEYNLRNTLSGITQQRGVIAYSVPKFWQNDRPGSEDRLLGFVHVVAAKNANMEDVRDRVKDYLAEHKMDVVVQVEREGDSSCWCGIGRTMPALAGSHTF